MSRKPSSGKAVPILSIVFFGVSLILFAAKAIVAIIYRLFAQRSDALHILVAESGKVVAFAFPAIFFIICAGLYLGRSPAHRKLLMTGYAMQIVSSLILLGRLVYVQSKNGFKNIGIFTLILMVLLAMIAVFCFIIAILEARGKKKKGLIIFTACCGFLLAIIFALTFIIPVLTNFSYFVEHVAVLLSTMANGLLYALALTFYYVAFLLTAFYKKELPKPAEKVKVVVKSK